MNVKWHLPGDATTVEGHGRKTGERACFTKQTNPTKAKGESLGSWVGRCWGTNVAVATLRP